MKLFRRHRKVGSNKQPEVLRKGTVDIGCSSNSLYVAIDCTDIKVGETIHLRKTSKESQKLHFFFQAANICAEKFKVQVVDDSLDNLILVVVKAGLPPKPWSQDLKLDWVLVRASGEYTHGENWEKEDQTLMDSLEGLMGFQGFKGDLEVRKAPAIVKKGVLYIGSLTHGTYFPKYCRHTELGKAIGMRKSSKYSDFHFFFRYSKTLPDRFKIQIVDEVDEKPVLLVVRSDLPFATRGQDLQLEWVLVQCSEKYEHGTDWEREDGEVVNFCEGLLDSLHISGRMGYTRMIHQPLTSLVENNVLSHWASFAGENDIAQFQRACDMICVHPKLLSSSRVSCSLEILEQGCPADITVYMVCSIVRKLLKTSTDYSGMFSRMKEGIGFRANYVFKILFVILTKETHTRNTIEILLSDMEEQLKWCFSRRVSLFEQLLERATRAIKASNPNTATVLAELNDASADANMILEELTNFAEEIKVKAFQEVFIIPALAYYLSLNDTPGFMHVEIHGANFYSAILLSTLGVRIGFPLLLSDKHHMSCPDFLSEATTRKILKAMWDGRGPDSNHLKDTDVRDLLIKEYGNDPIKHVTNFRLLDGRAKQPFDLANAAVDAVDTNLYPNKEGLKHYLEGFASYFLAEKFVPACISSLTSRVNENVLSRYLTKKYGFREGCSSYEFFWTMNEEDPTQVDLNYSVASKFLFDLGILRKAA